MVLADRPTLAEVPLADLDFKPTNQFPGWPVTIQQTDNRGENVIG
jgi:hypothetical protein